jgi:uncharacterized RDD family membrane protein YckC
MEHPDLEYVGFWRRFAASLIDTVLLLPIVYALAVMVYGPGYFLDTRLIKGGADFIISWVLPAVLVIWLWVIWSGRRRASASSARASWMRKPAVRSRRSRRSFAISATT